MGGFVIVKLYVNSWWFFIEYSSCKIAIHCIDMFINEFKVNKVHFLWSRWYAFFQKIDMWHRSWFHEYVNQVTKFTLFLFVWYKRSANQFEEKFKKYELVKEYKILFKNVLIFHSIGIRRFCILKYEYGQIYGVLTISAVDVLCDTMEWIPL